MNFTENDMHDTLSCSYGTYGQLRWDGLPWSHHSHTSSPKGNLNEQGLSFTTFSTSLHSTAA